LNNPVSPRFAAVFQAEVLFNLKRVATYALMVLFSANAFLWWGWGPAVSRGWAVNSDFYIVRLFGGFSFMTMPLFVALLMGDPVVRDFRVRIDPLIFSKPVSRAEYLSGKFFGNFFVLVCCQACFALTLLSLQAFSTEGMIVLSPRLLPYLQHFFFFVVVSSLLPGVVCFTVGTLTRNVKVVYGLAVSFYFLYVAWNVTIKGLPMRWRVALDPVLFIVGAEMNKGQTAEGLNQLTVTYDGYMIANRVLVLAVSALLLAILYSRFSTSDRAEAGAGQNQTSFLNLAPQVERLYHEAEPTRPAPPPRADEAPAKKPVEIPRVGYVNEGLRAGLGQFGAALGVEFRLLLAERSLVVIAPLVMFLCGLELAAYDVARTASYSAEYAAGTANTLLLFLFAVAVFYTGESMHRDRETRIEPMLWSTPTHDFALLVSKFAATLLLSLSLVALVGVTAAAIQMYKGHAPFEPQKYLATYAVILVPSVIFMTAASVALNVLLRDKYLTYAVSLALAGALYYLTGQGYDNPLYNPVLYQLWSPADLANGGGRLARVLTHRAYCLALSSTLLALALIFFGRKSTRGFMKGGRLSGAGWTVLAAVASTLLAVFTGLMISFGA
jgi:ABC-type transport system involved in multi-copper enzyme maturation permease subunit